LLNKFSALPRCVIIARSCCSRWKIRDRWGCITENKWWVYI